MRSLDWIPETLENMEMFCVKNNLRATAAALRHAIEVIDGEMRRKRGGLELQVSSATGSLTRTGEKTGGVIRLSDKIARPQTGKTK